MAEKRWITGVSTAAGAAAAAGAAQLGLGYGLGVIGWPTVGAPDDGAWLGSLGWAIWITASATVCGAVVAGRFHGEPARRADVRGRLTLAMSAAAGALAAVVLIALAARSAVRVGTAPPALTAAGYATLGVAIGLVVAYWAVVSEPVAMNLLGTAIWLWTLAVCAVLAQLTLHRRTPTYLTSWQFAGTDHRYGTIFWPSAALTMIAASLIGAACAMPAIRRGNVGTGTATSGAIGPLLIATAFLALAPQLAGTPSPLESAYLISPYAVLAGLAGSVLAVSVAQRREPAASQPTKPTASQPTKPQPTEPQLTTPKPSTPEPTKPEPTTPEPTEPEPTTPRRARAKKATPARKSTAQTAAKYRKPTVTPPPATPRVVRINPE